MRNQIIQKIFAIAKDKDAFDKLESYFATITKAELTQNIIQCGILPEAFAHDSSEEKLWAKYSDIVLAKALSYLDIPSEVLRARGNSADVFGKNVKYSIVGDAKTFRLSRTAKNQKDFKIKSLDDWRKTNSYAMLVAPLTQYPQKKSQIYEQAIDKNVTLISYTHLYFLLDFYQFGQDLTLLWETGNVLKPTLSASEYENSKKYWEAIDTNICNIVGKDYNELQKHKDLDVKITTDIGKEGIEFWNTKIQEYNQLNKEDAIKKLIKAEKIDAKIETIEKAIKDLTT